MISRGIICECLSCSGCHAVGSGVHRLNAGTWQTRLAPFGVLEFCRGGDGVEMRIAARIPKGVTRSLSSKCRQAIT
jgi:hypothetical protein